MSSPGSSGNTSSPIGNSRPSVLVVDDDLNLLRIVRKTLDLEGFETVTANNGDEGLRAFNKQFQAVILDVRMPGIDGVELCRRIRAASLVPVVMLTAADDESDAVAGLEAGADDYIRKPVGASELVARLKAAIRRSRGSPSQNAAPTVSVGPLEVDFNQRIARLNGEEIRLSITEYRLIAFLVENGGRVMPRDEILRNVWGDGYEGENHLLNVTISRMRGRLALPGGMLETVPGVGYRMNR
ncbi:MAG: response regulator [Dehalococcoidia bacterium]|nr:response regulator [Dehalococcoidia bacterium]